jgi:hypothetical protein
MLGYANQGDGQIRGQITALARELFGGLLPGAVQSLRMAPDLPSAIVADDEKPVVIPSVETMFKVD